MVDVQANSKKLRDRAHHEHDHGPRLRRLLKLLRRAKWNVKTAIVMHERRLTYADAKTGCTAEARFGVRSSSLRRKAWLAR